MKHIRSDNVVWHITAVSREEHNQLHRHRSQILWFTGLPGAGKSTLADALEARLKNQKCDTIVLDGDNARHGLCGNLGFTAEDRVENIRRIGEMSKPFINADVIALTAFISPFASDTQRVREPVGDGDFIEIYCRCSLETCGDRDVNGRYKKARRGEISNFTGISSLYDKPRQAENIVDTDTHTIDECVNIIIAVLESRGTFHKPMEKNTASVG